MAETKSAGRGSGEDKSVCDRAGRTSRARVQTRVGLSRFLCCRSLSTADSSSDSRLYHLISVPFSPPSNRTFSIRTFLSQVLSRSIPFPQHTHVSDGLRHHGPGQHWPVGLHYLYLQFVLVLVPNCTEHSNTNFHFWPEVCALHRLFNRLPLCLFSQPPVS